MIRGLFWTVKEVAEILGIKPWQVKKLIKGKKLDVWRGSSPDDWVICDSEVENYLLNAQVVAYSAKAKVSEALARVARMRYKKIVKQEELKKVERAK